MIKLWFKKTAREKKIQNICRENFLLYSPRKIKTEPASFTKIDTEVTAFLPTDLKGFIKSKFRSDKINEVFLGKHHCWVGILNQSFENHIEIKKRHPLGYLFIESENLKFEQIPTKRKTPKQKRVTIRMQQKRKRQAEVFELIWPRLR